MGEGKASKWTYHLAQQTTTRNLSKEINTHFHKNLDMTIYQMLFLIVKNQTVQ